MLVFSLGLILAGAMTGKHRLIRFFLAGEFWGPWAKLTFMTYLIHMLVYYFFYGNVRMSSNLNHADIIWSFVAVILVSYFVSIAFSIAFEAPFLHMEKFFIFPE